MSKIWSISVSILTIIIILSISNDIINNNITFCLNGEKDYEILVNTEYKDEGIIANIFNKNISNKVKITSNLNINKIGSYYIKYNLKYFLNNYKLKRTILVNDKEQPSIKLDGETELSLYIGDIYQESGAIAIDNYDGDITDKIIISGTVDTSKVGTYELKYTIKDSSGNENFVIRKIIVKEKIVKPTTNYNCVKYSDNYNNDDPVIRYIKDNNYRVSVGYYNLITNDEYFYQANKIYYGASLLKTLDAIYIYEKNLINDRTKGWVKKAITVSDNDSHYYLYNYIGIDNLRNYGRSLGACNTLSGTDNYGNTTVSDQMVYLKKLYEMTKDNSELKSYFINNHGNYLKFNNIDIMHKYGQWNYYYHDVGIVLDEQPYIIVVLTEHNNSRNIITDISKLINEYHNSNK